MVEIISLLQEAVQKELPGWAAHSKMINYERPRLEDLKTIDPEARESAVLALIYPKKSIPHIVLILRNVYNGTHSGQVGFPGGKPEPEDETLWDTALREANEEVGLISDQVIKIGELSQVYIPPSRFLVTPFLAYTNQLPYWQKDIKEVKEIIEIPLSELLHANVIKEKYMDIRQLQTRIKVKYFDIQNYTIWGATAMILSELTHLLQDFSEQ